MTWEKNSLHLLFIQPPIGKANKTVLILCAAGILLFVCIEFEIFSLKLYQRRYLSFNMRLRFRKFAVLDGNLKVNTHNNRSFNSKVIDHRNALSRRVVYETVISQNYSLSTSTNLTCS